MRSIKFKRMVFEFMRFPGYVSQQRQGDLPSSYMLELSSTSAQANDKDTPCEFEAQL